MWEWWSFYLLTLCSIILFHFVPTPNDMFTLSHTSFLCCLTYQLWFRLNLSLTFLHHVWACLFPHRGTVGGLEVLCLSAFLGQSNGGEGELAGGYQLSSLGCSASNRYLGFREKIHIPVSKVHKLGEEGLINRQLIEWCNGREGFWAKVKEI